VLQLQTAPLPPVAVVGDDSPTDVMTRQWWMVQVIAPVHVVQKVLRPAAQPMPLPLLEKIRPDLWEPPAPIVPQLPLELLTHSTIRRARARSARRTADSRAMLAPVSLLLAALSLVPPASSVPAPSPPARTVTVSLRTAMDAPGTTTTVVSAPARVVAPVPAQVRVAVQRRPPAQAPRHVAPPPRASSHLVREVPF
jgi:hypothetical protein